MKTTDTNSLILRQTILCAASDRVKITQHFIDACMDHGVEHAVILSIIGAGKHEMSTAAKLTTQHNTHTKPSPTLTPTLTHNHRFGDVLSRLAEQTVKQHCFTASSKRLKSMR